MDVHWIRFTMLNNKLIHQDEFRLRVLLTNKCDKNCDFCLNDFQPKCPLYFADMIDVTDCIRAYGQFMRSINETSIVTFSGGEPGIYPHLEAVLANARYRCDIVKVVTNGSAFYHDSKYVDHWNIHVTDRVPLSPYRNHVDNITIQIVVTEDMTYEDLFPLVDYYHSAGFLIKLFSEFNSKHQQKIENLILEIYELYDREKICGRFTGVQVNRGHACENCKMKCVTLKALWYFPDGSSSTCPQGRGEMYDDDCWDETVEKAYYAHKVKGS